jgi:hypothetical protein
MPEHLPEQQNDVLPTITFEVSESEIAETPRASAFIIASLVESLGLIAIARDLEMEKHHGVRMEHILLVFLLFSAYGVDSVSALQEKAQQDTALGKILEDGGVADIADHVLRYFRKRHSVEACEELLRRFVGNQSQGRFKSRPEGVLALDDCTIEKFGKHMENIAVVYDHVEKRFCLGYVVVSTCYNDGDRMFPVNFQFRIQTEEEQRRVEEAKLKKEAGIDFRTKDAVLDWLQVLEHEGRLPSTFSLVGRQSSVNAFEVLDARKIPWVAAAHQRLPLQYANSDKTRKWDWEELKRKTLENKPDVSDVEGLKFYAKEVTIGGYSPEVDFVIVTTLAGQEVDTLVLKRAPHQERVQRILHFFEREGDPEASKLHIGVELIRRAKTEAKNKAETVAMDAWFCVNWFILALLEIQGIKRVVSRLKSNTMVFFGKQWMTVDQLWNVRGLKFRNERQRHLQWTRLKVRIDGLGEVAVVLVRELDKKRPGRVIAEYVLLCSDPDYYGLKIITAYKLRWGIEVFYRAAKQRFGMTKFHDESFVAIHFHMTIVFLAYLLTAVLRHMTPSLEEYTLGQIIDLYLCALVRVKRKGRHFIVMVAPSFLELFGSPPPLSS